MTPPSERLRLHATSLAALPPRQRELAQLIARGMLNKEIAVVMQLSEQTVKNMISTLLLRLGVRTRVDIATWVVAQDDDPDVPLAA